MSKQRNIRKRRAVDDDEGVLDNAAHGDEPQRLTAEEIKLLQKQRHKRNGVDATALALGADRGGKNIVSRLDYASGEADVLKATFNRERKQYSEEQDPEMRRFIEEQLAQRLGKKLPDSVAAEQAKARQTKTIEDHALEAVAPKQRSFNADPGAAFVAGVTEVPLDVEHRMRNIEATEAAKAALIKGKTYQDDDDYDDKVATGITESTRRSHFPVHFGRQNPKEVAQLQAIAAKKARLRAQALERKKVKEFKGW